MNSRFVELKREFFTPAEELEEELFYLRADDIVVVEPHHLRGVPKEELDKVKIFLRGIDEPYLAIGKAPNILKDVRRALHELRWQRFTGEEEVGYEQI